MYLNFYNLQKEPFSLSPDPAFLFTSEAHKEALAHLQYGLLQRKGFVLITGEVGTGKTTLLNYLVEKIPQEIRIAYISNPKLTKEEFFYLLSEKFKLGTIANKADFLIKITKFLEDAYRNDHNVVLIVDEAHCLTGELLEEIRLLSNLETPNAKLLNIILVGQPELENIINQFENRALKQRINLRYSLNPLNEKETTQYIQFRLSRAGARDIAIFNSHALKSIFEYSKGIPRIINLLADHALLTGFVKEAKTIDDQIIKECARELDLSPSDKTIIALDSSDSEKQNDVKKRYLNLMLLLSISISIVMTVWLIHYMGIMPKEDFLSLIRSFIAKLGW